MVFRVWFLKARRPDAYRPTYVECILLYYFGRMEGNRHSYTKNTRILLSAPGSAPRSLFMGVFLCDLFTVVRNLPTMVYIHVYCCCRYICIYMYVITKRVLNTCASLCTHFVEKFYPIYQWIASNICPWLLARASIDEPCLSLYPLLSRNSILFMNGSRQVYAHGCLRVPRPMSPLVRVPPRPLHF